VCGYFFQALLHDSHIEKHDELLRIISDPCSRYIINFIQIEPKTAIQISNELGRELSAIYRRLHKLEKHNLLKTTVQITHDGKKSYYYQSKINGVNLSYQNGNFDVSLSFNQI
jgi:predicted transcriptional regulator